MIKIKDDKIIRICNELLNIPIYKIKYALITGLMDGMFKSLERYGIVLNDNTFNIFYNVVNSKLTGSDHIEYEWTEEEYNSIMKIKNQYGKN